FKKSGYLLRSGSEVKYAFVEKNRRQYGVPALCEALQVSRSGDYAERQRGPSDLKKRRVDLTARIRTIHQASRETYGTPRVRPRWTFLESPIGWHVDLEGVVGFKYPVRSIPVYRLWNQRTDSNHRYTTSTAIRAQMLAAGYRAGRHGPGGGGRGRSP